MDLGWLNRNEYLVVAKLGTELELVQQGNNYFVVETLPQEPDPNWLRQLSYIEHPDLLLPVGVCGTRVIYVGQEHLQPFSRYVSSVFSEYMAPEDLCLELAYRISRAWGQMSEKSCRQFEFFQPSSDRILMSASGDLRLLPPIFSVGKATSQSLVIAVGEMLFDNLTHPNTPAHKQEFYSAIREVNGEITAAAEEIVRRCLVDGPDRILGLGALTRCIHQQRIRYSPDCPFPDRGPLGYFKKPVQPPEYETNLQEAVQTQRKVDYHDLAPPTWLERLTRWQFYDRVENLRALFVVVYLVMIGPLFFGREWAEVALPFFLMSGIYWLFVIGLLAAYRRRRHK